MSIQIIKKNQQASGQFNGGEILENKPIGFPREGGHIKPYSNLFYWAHAWSDNGSTIGLHPHQGFEIMSFVLEGSIEHYDTGDKQWRKLEKGDAQIIRAGNGISHSEKLNAEAHIFQIWFDPNLNETIVKSASYDDYESTAFPIAKEGEMEVKTYKGEGSPLLMDTPGIEIKEFQLAKGEHAISIAADKMNSLYLISGSLRVDSQELETDDFFIVSDEGSLAVEALDNCRIFLIASPQQLDYATYAQLNRQ